ncbi:MAG: TetR family transcriptional regulator [Myxococcota bacterium]
MPTSDGRHARSERTREAVAEAMLDCFEDGLLRPGAGEVAARAGVSTRAVFRHFENMDALVEAAATLQLERLAGQLPPFAFEGTREQRVEALVTRAAYGFERTTRVRRAAELLEPFSEAVQDRYAWLRSEVRRSLRRAFAEELRGLSERERREKTAALRALLSFRYWEELRRHERLSVASAKRVLVSAIHSLLET